MPWDCLTCAWLCYSFFLPSTWTMILDLSIYIYIWMFLYGKCLTVLSVWLACVSVQCSRYWEVLELCWDIVKASHVCSTSLVNLASHLPESILRSTRCFLITCCYTCSAVLYNVSGYFLYFQSWLLKQNWLSIVV